MTAPRAKSGATLVEIMLAGALFSLVFLAVLEGLIVCAKISRDNAVALEMDATAFDLIWSSFSRPYSTIPAAGGGTTIALPLVWDRDSSGASAANSTPEYVCRYTETADSNGVSGGKLIKLEYGLPGRSRRTLELYRAEFPRNRREQLLSIH